MESDLKLRVLVLTADGDSPNLGVRVLATGTEILIRRAFGGDVEVDFQDLGAGNHGFALGRKALVLDFASSGRSRLSRFLSGYDLVIDTCGGDSFSDLYGVSRLATICATQQRVRNARVPLVLGPQTIGPFQTRTGQRLASAALKRTSAVIARDPVSAAFVETMASRSVILGTDPVFALPRPLRRETRDVIVNLSGLLWNSSTLGLRESYRRLSLTIIDKLLEEDRSISLLAHVLQSESHDDDTKVLQDLPRTILQRCEVLLPSTLDEARALIASSRYLIGARMHACLNAISVGTPALPLAYSRKFAPLLVDLGWPHHVALARVQESGPTISQVATFVNTDYGAALGSVNARADQVVDRMVARMGRVEVGRG